MGRTLQGAAQGLGVRGVASLAELFAGAGPAASPSAGLVQQMAQLVVVEGAAAAAEGPHSEVAEPACDFSFL